MLWCMFLVSTVKVEKDESDEGQRGKGKRQDGGFGFALGVDFSLDDRLGLNLGWHRWRHVKLGGTKCQNTLIIWTNFTNWSKLRKMEYFNAQKWTKKGFKGLVVTC